MRTRLIPGLAAAVAVAGLALTSANANVAAAAQALTLGAGAAAAPNADTDGDKLFEALSARLDRLSADDRLSVIVRLSGDLTSEQIAALEGAVGRFELTRSLPILDGFA